MGQKDVYNIMLKNNKWLTAREIRGLLLKEGLDISTVPRSLMRMEKYGEVKHSVDKRWKAVVVVSNEC
jgi:Fe2+ or Zn2+ uptake regulation protein